MIEYDQNMEVIEQAIKSEQPNLALENWVNNLSQNGETKRDIYQFLYNYFLYFQETNEFIQIEKVNGDHPVVWTMDRLSGYCHEGAHLIPDEDIND